MVKQFYLVLAFMALFINVSEAAVVEVTAAILQDALYENQPMKGVVSISHPRAMLVEKDTFLIGNQKLQVDFVKEVRADSGDPLVLSIYNFKLPGKPKGAYTLPSISVKVGGTVYHSIMSGYTVISGKKEFEDAPLSSKADDVVSKPQTPALAKNPSQNQAVNSPSSNRPSIKPLLQGDSKLRLDAGVDGAADIYPGQNTKVFYRYHFRGNVGLTKEEIPLLDAKGFLKIGEKEIKDYTEGDINVREISQVMQAIKPGTFDFGPSRIEGVAYDNDANGNPVYSLDKLSSEAPVVQVVVLPFPEKLKPASFSGAVGKFTFKTVLSSSDKLQVGDTVTISLIIQGKGNMSNLSVPDLCCQPGFSGFFKQSDLPPKEMVEGDVKTVSVQLKVLSDKVKEIPGIEFSYFDPATADYKILKSDPIPIFVKPALFEKQNEPAEKDARNNSEINSQANLAAPLTTSATASIEVETIMSLKPLDLYDLPFGSFAALAFLPLGIASIAYQYHLKNYLEWKKTLKVPLTSKDLFNQAFKNEKECNFENLQNALLLELKEKGVPKTHELTSKVEAYLAGIDEMRFGKSGIVIDILNIKKEAEALYRKVQNFKGGQ